MSQRVYIFWGLFSALLILVGTYLYLVNSLIFDIVQRQNRLDILAKIKSEVAVLEADQLKKTGKITLDLAGELGYQDAAKQTIFVLSGEPAQSLVR